MSLLRVTQSVTAEGKIQIDVLNTSGLPPSRAAPRISTGSSSSSSRGPGVSNVPDREEPCSLIVSLRSSHPQFFYYRGLPQKQGPPMAISCLHTTTPGSAGYSGNGEDYNVHQRRTSLVWNLEEDVDPCIEEASREAWKELKFLPVTVPAAEAAARPVTAAATPSLPNQLTKPSNGEDRPLLVREELADCILLPGERHTFLLEIDTPSVLRRLVAPVAQEKAQVKNKPRASQPPWSGQQTPLQSTDSTRTTLDDTGIFLVEHNCGGRKGFLTQVDAIVHTDKRNPASPLKSVHPAEKNATLTSGDGGHQPLSHKLDAPELTNRSGNTNKTKTSSDKHANSRTAQLGRKQQLARKGAPPLDAHSRKANLKGGTKTQKDESNEQTDSDLDSNATVNSDECVSSRPPLSIVRNSTSTRRSLGTASPAAATAPSDSVLGSSNSTEESSPFARKPYRDGDRRSDALSHIDAGSCDAPSIPCASEVDETTDLENGNMPHPQRWSSLVPVSQRPTFYVYYAPLGDENKCLEHARKWLLKEQLAYRLWLGSTVRKVVELERRRELGWTRRSDGSVQSRDPPLGARRVLPPTLGELVRWRADGGGGGSGSGAALDTITQSPITAAVFQYYYGSNSLDSGVRRVDLPTRGGGGGGNPDSHRSTRALVELPPSFASTRRHRVSKKAHKMFREDRNGAGAVVLPLRLVQRHPAALHSHPIAGSSEFSPPSKTKFCSLSMSPFAQQPQHPWNPRTFNASPSPRPYTVDKSTDQEDNWGSSSRLSEHKFSEPHRGEPLGFKAGCGMALLEESLPGLPTPSHNSIAEGATTAMPLQRDHTKILTNTTQKILSESIRVDRTDTLDPATAEMAAMNPSMTQWSPLFHMHHQDQSRHPESPLQSQPGPQSTSSVGEVASSDSFTWNNSSSCTIPLPSVSSKVERVKLGVAPSPSSRAPDSLTVTHDLPGAAPMMGQSVSPNGRKFPLTDALVSGPVIDGSLSLSTSVSNLAAQLLQPFYGGNSVKIEAEDEAHSSPHWRNISSAPPQTLMYRRRANGLTNNLTMSTLVTNGSLSIRRQESLNWIAGQSKAASTQVRVAARQFTVRAGVACSTAVDLAQQHGPPIMSTLTSVVNIIRDTVFTSENVQMMQVTITPLIMVLSILVVAYLILGGEGDDEIFMLMENRGLL